MIKFKIFLLNSQEYMYLPNAPQNIFHKQGNIFGVVGLSGDFLGLRMLVPLSPQLLIFKVLASPFQKGIKAGNGESPAMHRRSKHDIAFFGNEKPFLL